MVAVICTLSRAFIVSTFIKEYDDDEDYDDDDDDVWWDVKPCSINQSIDYDDDKWSTLLF